jgi:protocatechuate 3,4-dioxygenase beta subunit
LELKTIAGYRKAPPGTQPELLHPPYASCIYRAPKKQLIQIPQTLSEMTGPIFRRENIRMPIGDLTRSNAGLAKAIGQRIVVSGRLLDQDARPVPHSLVEIWQANAGGRYLHATDQHDAPLDPNFTGIGHTFTDELGRYKFITILPGRYPWRNHYNAWRPAHIHFSLFGPAIATRLITQMYFPGDPLLPFDPIFNFTSDENAKARLIAEFDWATTEPESALGYKFDIVLRGRNATPMETE